MTRSRHILWGRRWIETVLGCALLLAGTIHSHAASETFVWLPNSEPDVAGYRIYYGSPPGEFSEIADVGNVTRATIDGLAPGAAYRFYATCYNTAGLESDPSDSVELVTATDPTENRPPVALGATVTTVSGELTTITLEAEDPDGDPLSFNLASFPTNGDIIEYPIADGYRATLTYQSFPGYTGADEFSFTVNDGYVDSVPSAVTLHVAAVVNSAPAVDAGPEATVTRPGWTTLHGKATDDGLPGSHTEPVLTWTLASGPPGAHIQEPNSGSTKVTFSEDGTYLFRLEAFDGELTGHDAVAVYVGTLSNALPSLDPYTLHLEAESGALTDPVRSQADPAASSSAYIHTDTPDQGTATFTFDLPHDASVIVWCRVRTPSADADSFLVTLNDDPATADIYDASEGDFSNDWKWTPLYGRGGVERTDDYACTLAPRVFDLAAGQHQLTFGGRDPGTQLDALIITSDPNFDPIAASISTQAPVLTDLQPLPDQGVTLSWSAIPGRHYQIAYQDALGTGDWILLPDLLQAGTDQLQIEHHLPPTAGHRFYRALLLP